MKRKLVDSAMAKKMSFGYVLLILLILISLLIQAIETPNMVNAEQSVVTPHLAIPQEVLGEVIMPASLQQAYSTTVGEQNTDYHFVQKGDHFYADNPQHDLNMRLGQDGVELTKGDTTWSMYLVSWGSVSDVIKLDTLTIEVEANRLTYHYDGLDEWYINGPAGLEQGFTIYEELDASQILLDLELIGNWRNDNNRLSLLDENGNVQFVYSQPIAWDANHKPLPIKVHQEETRMQLELNVEGTIYPLTIDPWIYQMTVYPDISYSSFGDDVSIDGNTAIIGAAAEPNGGSAYIFVSDNGQSWTLQAKFVSPYPNTNAYFGYIVDISGDFAIVGSFFHLSSTGAAHVYQRNGNTWSLDQELIGSGIGVGSGFGDDIAMEGNIAIVGAYGHNSGTGAVYVFEKQETTWIEIQILTASDGEASDIFGFSIAFDGTTIAIGAIGDDDLGENFGAIYIFRHNGSQWYEDDKITPPDGGIDQFAGHSVSLRGDTLAIGTKKYAAYVYIYDGSNWTMQGRLIPNNAPILNNCLHCFYRVAYDNDTVAVGYESIGFGYGAYVFSRTDTVWTEQPELTVNNASVNTESIAIDNNIIVVGALVTPKAHFFTNGIVSTSTPLPTATVTPTPTNTPTDTSTSTPTATSTTTLTDTSTATSTGTPIGSATNTPSNTVTDTPTGILTDTVTPSVTGTTQPEIQIFDPALSKIGVLGEGELGLSGETIIWTIVATNTGQVSAPDVVITDTLPAELRIDDVTTTQGNVAITGQTVIVTIGMLNPEDSVTITITTTILNSPIDGQFINTAYLTGDGQSRMATATVDGITGLPTTGYLHKFRW